MLTNLPVSQLYAKTKILSTDDMYNTNLLDLNYTVVDLETTGTKPLTNQIIEIGIVKIEHGKITDTYQTFVNPGTDIPPFISQMTGISNADVEYAPLFPDIVPKIMPYIENNIFVAHNAGFDYSFLQKNLKACGIDYHAPKICTVQLSRKLLPQLAHHKLDDLVKHFHIQIDNRHRALDDALATGKSLLSMFEILMQTGKKVFGALADFSQPSETKKYKILKPTIDALPLTPGVYFMKNKEGHIIYVGKSKCLQKRVRSYFYSSEKKTRKLEKLVETVESIEYQQTGSELSALLLESKLIKEHLPHFNVMIRNYKAYPFLKLSNEPFPRLYVTREIKPDGATYYGPFKSSSALHHTIEHLQKAFKLRACKHKINPKKQETMKLCMYYELGDCPGVCGGKMSQEEYMHNIERCKAFLSGNEHIIINKLQSQIDQLSETLQYEKAAEIRDQQISLERVLEKQQKIARSVRDNNVVIVQDGIDKNTKEIFCIKNGIVHTRLIAKTKPHTYSSDQKSYSLSQDHASAHYLSSNLRPAAHTQRTLYDVQAALFNDDIYTDETTLPFYEYQSYQKRKDDDTHQIWLDTLSGIYNRPEETKVTKENIDDLMIISTWLMQHGETRQIHFVSNVSAVSNTAEYLAQKYLI